MRIKCLFQALHGLFDNQTRAGQVEALEQRRRRAEDGAGIQPQFCLVHDQVLKFLLREAVGGKVHPEEVGAVRVDDHGLREVLLDKGFGVLHVAVP